MERRGATACVGMPEVHGAEEKSMDIVADSEENQVQRQIDELENQVRSTVIQMLPVCQRLTRSLLPRAPAHPESSSPHQMLASPDPPPEEI